MFELIYHDVSIVFCTRRLIVGLNCAKLILMASLSLFLSLVRYRKRSFSLTGVERAYLMGPAPLRSFAI